MNGSRWCLGVLGCLLLMAIPRGANAQCSGAGEVWDASGCHGLTYAGCCVVQRLLWCENQVTCTIDCSSNPSCGWPSPDINEGYYDCGSNGSQDPSGSNPIDCPSEEVDADGDGYNSQSSGGDDCNDNNANVHPFANENCSNGIDDDCDGYVDGNDADCAGTDDDDDDDDAGFDDDLSDDDTHEGPRNTSEVPALGIVCGCSQDGAHRTLNPVLLAIALGLLMVRRRR